MGLDIYMLATDVPPEKYYAAYKQLRDRMVELDKQGISPWSEDVPQDVKDLREFCQSVRDYSYEKYVESQESPGEFPYEFRGWRKDYTIVDELEEIWYDTGRYAFVGDRGAYHEAVYYPAAIYLSLEDGSFQRLRNLDVWHNWTNEYLGVEAPMSQGDAFDRIAWKLKEWRAAEKFLKTHPDHYLVVVLSP